VLPNLILGKNAIPEYLDADANPDRLATAILPLLSDTPERAKQIAAFARLESLMALDHGTPSSRAADIVLTSMRKRPGALAGPV
jgi:lipid-A-disaccharide synthase